MKVLRGKPMRGSFLVWKRLAILLSVLLIVVGMLSYVRAEESPSTTSLIIKMVAGLSA